MVGFLKYCLLEEVKEVEMVEMVEEVEKVERFFHFTLFPLSLAARISKRAGIPGS